MLKIGIVGCGAIGSSLAETIMKDFSGRARLSFLFDVDPDKSRKLSKALIGKGNLSAGSLEALISNSDMVIEAACASASADIARSALRRKRSVMVMSVGGILREFSGLSDLAKHNSAKIYIPSGAISGVDALKAQSLGKIKAVTLTTSKNPLAFQGVKYIKEKKINLAKIRHPRVLFSGSAIQAVKYFPQNINVAAILSLAGIGPYRTKVRLVADPKIKNNIHEIRIVSRSGSVYTRTENVLHPDNPKTSYLAFLSAVAVLKQILEPVRIGT